jgi:tripartite-type tricarboxylate transporter receptor subunit TctC
MKDAFVKLGLDSQPGTPEQFAAFLRNELAQNAKVVKFARIKIE